MPLNSLNYYQHSGRFSMPGLFRFTMVMLVLTFLLAYFYNLLINIIPFIYFNVVFTLGFGVMIGFLARFFSYAGKVRNKPLIVGLAAFVAIVGWYMQWVALMGWLAFDSHGFAVYIESFIEFGSPTVMFQNMALVAQEGFWSLGFGSNGATVNGFVLQGVWVLEFIIMVAAAIFIAAKMQIEPFSERFDKWYKRHTVPYDFKYVANVNAFERQLQESPIDTLQNMPLGDARRHAKIYIYFLEEEEDQYLSLANVYVTNTEKNKKDIDTPIHLFRINKHTAASIINMQQPGQQESQQV